MVEYASHGGSKKLDRPSTKKPSLWRDGFKYGRIYLFPTHTPGCTPFVAELLGRFARIFSRYCFSRALIFLSIEIIRCDERDFDFDCLAPIVDAGDSNISSWILGVDSTVLCSVSVGSVTFCSGTEGWSAFCSAPNPK
jgi:hypothetical protein